MKIIKFKDDKLPYVVMASSDRYAVCTRSIDRKVDKKLIKDLDKEEIETLPIYTLIDFKEGIRAPNNRVFNSYDYSTKDGCEECLKDLELGVVELSRRRKVDLQVE